MCSNSDNDWKDQLSTYLLIIARRLSQMHRRLNFEFPRASDKLLQIKSNDRSYRHDYYAIDRRFRADGNGSFVVF